MAIQKTKIQVLYLVIMIIYGCSPIYTLPINTPSVEQKDMSPFTGIPCAPPCWRGLSLGLSSENEVKSTLNTLSYIKHDSVVFHKMLMPSLNPNEYKQGVEILARCVSINNECLKLQVVDNILLEVNLLLNYKISFKEAIDYLDNPDFIGYQTPTGEKIYCQILMIWQTKQIILKSKILSGIDYYQNTCENFNNQLLEGLSVLEVTYLAKNGIDLLLLSNAHYFFEYLATTSN